MQLNQAHGGALPRVIRPQELGAVPLLSGKHER